MEGTLIHDLLTNAPDVIRCSDGKLKQRKIQIEYISFSAHVDYTQNSRFIRSVRPDNIILVHGERKGMRKLREELEREISRSWSTRHKPPVKTPANGQSVKISFSKSVVADIVGSAADELFAEIQNRSTENEPLSLPSNLMIVNENFNVKAVKVEDLKKHTPCRLGKLTQRFLVPVPAGMHIYQSKSGYENGVLLQALAPFIQEVFDSVCRFLSYQRFTIIFQVLLTHEGQWVIDIHRLVVVSETNNGSVVSIEWPASPQGDTIADTVVGIVTQFLSVPSVLRQLGYTEKGSILKGANEHHYCIFGIIIRRAQAWAGRL